MNDYLVLVCIFIAIIVGLTGATLIGLANAEAARACFEAAKVNPAVTCEVKKK